MIGLNSILFVLAVFAGSFILNFVSIHSMANLILIDGSSKRKSASLSIQYALLTATLTLVAVIALEILGEAREIELWMSSLIIFSGDSTLILLLKWWYTKITYETTYLYAFLIVEWVYILLWLASLLAINLI